MTKRIEWIDGDGLPRLSEVPDDAGIEDAPLGIPLSIDPEWLDYPEPFRRELYCALWEEGLKTVDDFNRTDTLTRINQVIRRLVKYDANDIRLAIIRGVEADADQ